MTHAKLSPSKAHHWRACPGALREEAKYPDPGPSPSASDGTHTHTLVEHCTKGGLGDLTAMIGVKMKDDDGEFVIDAARAARAKVAIDYVNERVAGFMGLCMVKAESRVDPAYLVGRNDLSGTVDIQIQSADMLEIIDYKDGMAPVVAEDNLQLEQYAIGALAGFKLPINGNYPVDTIRMTIIQPKVTAKGLNPITSVEMPVHTLLAKIPRLVIDAAKTDDPNAPLVPGESQCKYCRAKGGCSALMKTSTSAIGLFSPVDLAQQAADKTPATMTNQQIRDIVEAAPLVRQMIEGAEEEALRRLKSGVSIPGLKLVNGRGSRTWNQADDQIADKLKRMGLPKDIVWETKLISVAKAEKATWESTKGGEKVRKQLSERQLKVMETEYVTKLAGKLTVVSDSDSRPAVTLNAAPLFSAVVETPVESIPAWLS